MNDVYVNEKRKTRSINFVGPLILVTLGVLLLLDNLNLMPWGFWEAILRLWPAVLVGWGVEGIVNRDGLVGPVALIGLGAVLLLSNLGVLAQDVWQVLLRLWPILLIAFGLDIFLTRRRSVLLSLLAVIAILALLGGALWLMATGMGAEQIAGEEIEQALPREGVNQAEVVVEPGIGTLRIEALPESGHLVKGTIQLEKGEDVIRDFAVEDETATFTLRTGGATWGPFAGGWGPDRLWDLGVSAAVPLQLKLDLGLGQTEANLTGLTLVGLNLNAGLGQSEVTLPEKGRFWANVDGAIGQTVIVIPEGLEARVILDTGLTARILPESYRCQENVCTSPGYINADHRVDLDVSQAIGLVTIRRP